MDGYYNVQAGANEKKLRKEIESIQFRKQSMIAAVQAEINGARQQKDGICFQIGRAVLENREQEQLAMSEFAESFAQIDALDGQICEREAKIAEIASRHDEEIQMLGSMLPPPPQAYGQAPLPPYGQAQMPPYGQAPMAPPPMGLAPMAPPPMGPPPIMPAPQAMPEQVGACCPMCGAPYRAGVDKFCIACGHKLD
jgi:hypothetical protein